MLLYVPRYANYRAVFCKQQVAIIWLLHLGSYIVHAALALYCTWTPCTPNSLDKSMLIHAKKDKSYLYNARNASGQYEANPFF